VALLELAFPLAVAWFIDKLLPQGNWSQIVSVSIGLFLVYVMSMLLQYIVIT
jgi:ATP-binding cassette, subfamily B, bacterial